jgi:integrase
MARRATGSVEEHVGRDGTVYRSLRFSAYGKRRRVPLGAVSRQEAERQLRGVLADVERGVWEEPGPPPPEPEGIPNFHEFAEVWWLEREREWRDSTRERYRCCLELHLLPFFGSRPLPEITIAEVDRYKAEKLRDTKLAAATINKTLVLLSSILGAAEERELISRNPALGRRRRVRAQRPNRSYLDTSEQVAALLEAAEQLDAERARSDRQHINRRALLSVLTFAGLRLGEALSLRWRDVDLATGRLRIGDAKTEAGRRYVTIRPALRDDLASLRTVMITSSPESLVFATSTGRPLGATNVRRRVLAPAVERANAMLAFHGSTPLPEGLTPHSLRRTFASLLYAIGEDPPTVMAEMGHASPALALRIYAQAMRRDAGEKDRLRALLEGGQLADIGQRSTTDTSITTVEQAA